MLIALTITTGSRNLDRVLGLNETKPSIIALYGSSGSGKSQVIYTVGTIYAAKHGQLILATFSRGLPAERIYEISKGRGFDPDTVLDRIIVLHIKDQEGLREFVSSVDKLAALGWVRLILIDDLPELLAWTSSSAELSYTLLRLSLLVNENKAFVITTYPIRMDVDENVEKPLGYEYSWPYVDRFIRLNRLRGGVFYAQSSLGSARFRVSGRGVEDL